MAGPYDGAMTTPAPQHGFSHVRRVLPEHWASHRDQRLRMLQGAPDAFITTYEQVVDRSEEQWRRSLEGSVRFWQAVTADGAVVGGLGLVVEVRDGAAASTAPTAPTGSEIVAPRSGTSLCVVAMFVHRDHRGRGVTRALFARAAAEARALGATGLHLHVTDDNLPARRSYERLGLRPTGRREPDPRRPEHEELEDAATIDALDVG